MCTVIKVKEFVAPFWLGIMHALLEGALMCLNASWPRKSCRCAQLCGRAVHDRDGLHWVGEEDHCWVGVDGSDSPINP